MATADLYKELLTPTLEMRKRYHVTDPLPHKKMSISQGPGTTLSV